eukprot:CAMPEP_0198281988 /NCGR_PEP_ID=MMETSP1449-20131203/1865_1 /TAXON_ID=420275 /ORGANISM="Attheya septentrionalis, Strain CCMP2084" /LENGTH=445 /DNA_ID=CAMNT_0043978039 /DNA_START=148 /DNA_END=1485 /DNA_ORIENTATION=+
MTNSEVIEFSYGRNADLYADVLQVSSNASQDEIQHAFFQRRFELYRVLQATGGDSAVSVGEDSSSSVSAMSSGQKLFTERRMDAVVYAYRILGDPDERRDYDAKRAKEGSNKENNKENKKGNRGTGSRSSGSRRRMMDNPSPSSFDNPPQIPKLRRKKSFSDRDVPMDEASVDDSRTATPSPEDRSPSLIRTGPSTSMDSELDNVMGARGSKIPDPDAMVIVTPENSPSESTVAKKKKKKSSRSDIVTVTDQPTTVPPSPSLTSKGSEDSEMDYNDNDTITPVLEGKKVARKSMMSRVSSKGRGLFSRSKSRSKSRPRKNSTADIDHQISEDTEFDDVAMSPSKEESKSSVESNERVANKKRSKKRRSKDKKTEEEVSLQESTSENWCAGGVMEDCVSTVQEELKGSYLDTLSAVDQVWNVFTLKDHEIDGVLKKVDKAVRDFER